MNLLLIQCLEFHRPSTQLDPIETPTTFATRLSLGKAIERIRQFERVYEQRSSEFCLLEYTILSIQRISESVTFQQLEQGRIRIVEHLAQTVEDFK